MSKPKYKVGDCILLISTSASSRAFGSTDCFNYTGHKYFITDIRENFHNGHTNYGITNSYCSYHEDDFELIPNDEYVKELIINNLKETVKCPITNNDVSMMQLFKLIKTSDLDEYDLK